MSGGQRMGKSSMIMPDEFADMNAKETGSVGSGSDIKILNIVPRKAILPLSCGISNTKRTSVSSEVP